MKIKLFSCWWQNEALTVGMLQKKTHTFSFYPITVSSAQSWTSLWTANKLFDGERFLKMLKMHNAYKQKQINRQAWNSHTIWPHIRILHSAHPWRYAMNKTWCVDVIVFFFILFAKLTDGPYSSSFCNLHTPGHNINRKPLSYSWVPLSTWQHTSLVSYGLKNYLCVI